MDRIGASLVRARFTRPEPGAHSLLQPLAQDSSQMCLEIEHRLALGQALGGPAECLIAGLERECRPIVR